MFSGISVFLLFSRRLRFSDLVHLALALGLCHAQFVREFALWADTPVCDAERMDNFYQLQQLAFLSYLMNGDTIALLPMKH